MLQERSRLFQFGPTKWVAMASLVLVFIFSMFVASYSLIPYTLKTSHIVGMMFLEYIRNINRCCYFFRGNLTSDPRGFFHFRLPAVAGTSPPPVLRLAAVALNFFVAMADKSESGGLSGVVKPGNKPVYDGKPYGNIVLWETLWKPYYQTGLKHHGKAYEAGSIHQLFLSETSDHCNSFSGYEIRGPLFHHCSTLAAEIPTNQAKFLNEVPIKSPVLFYFSEKKSKLKSIDG